MAESITQAFVRIRPVLEVVLAAHHVPLERAESLLLEVLRLLCAKRPGVADPAAWMVERLHHVLEREGFSYAGPGRARTPEPPPQTC